LSFRVIENESIGRRKQSEPDTRNQVGVNRLSKSSHSQLLI
jgi:hypothetical protein